MKTHKMSRADWIIVTILVVLAVSFVANVVTQR
jgi:hypothetical protein